MRTMIFTSGYTHMVLTGRIEIVIDELNPSLINIFHGPSSWRWGGPSERGYVALKDAGTLMVTTL